MSTMPTDFPPSCDGGRNDQAGNITEEKIENADHVVGVEKPINIGSTMMVHQSKDKRIKKEVSKNFFLDGGKRRRIGLDTRSHTRLGLKSLLLKRKIEDGNNTSKKHINKSCNTRTVCQAEDQEFKLKGISNDSSFKGSKTINASSPIARENITLRSGCPTHREVKFASRDLKSLSLLGKGFSGIVYETIWNSEEERRYARKDFVCVPSDVFERETEVLLGLKPHSNVVQTIGWAVAKICCSLVLELMDCNLRSLAQRKLLLRRVTSSGFPKDLTLTKVDSGCSNSPQQEIEKKMNASNSPVSASSEAQTSSPFSIREVIQIITAIAEGMEYLHDNKVAHGDLKPGNILVTLKKRAGSSNFDESLKIETVKVVDFGVIESKSKSRCMTSVSSETREVDRIRWKAPELFDIDHGLKQDFDVWAKGDVFSFGMTASEILSGEEPYSDLPNLGVKTLREAIKKGTRPELPDQCLRLKELIKRCWDGEPTKRPDFRRISEEMEKIRAAHLPVEDFPNPGGKTLREATKKGTRPELRDQCLRASPPQHAKGARHGGYRGEVCENKASGVFFRARHAPGTPDIQRRALFSRVQKKTRQTVRIEESSRNTVFTVHRDYVIDKGDEVVKMQQLLLCHVGRLGPPEPARQFPLADPATCARWPSAASGIDRRFRGTFRRGKQPPSPSLRWRCPKSRLTPRGTANCLC